MEQKFNITLPANRRILVSPDTDAYAKRLSDNLLSLIKDEEKGYDLKNLQILMKGRTPNSQVVDVKINGEWYTVAIVQDISAEKGFTVEYWGSPIPYLITDKNTGVVLRPRWGMNEFSNLTSVVEGDKNLVNVEQVQYCNTSRFAYTEIRHMVRCAVDEGYESVKQARRYSGFKFSIDGLQKLCMKTYAQLGQMFNCIKVVNTPRDVEVVIEKFDYDKGAAYYFHGGSCWWGSYRYGAIEFAASPHSYAVMMYENGAPIGRCWLYGDVNRGTFFNFYGALTPELLAEVFSVQWGKKIRVNQANPSAIQAIIGTTRSFYVNDSEYCAYGRNRTMPSVRDSLA